MSERTPLPGGDNDATDVRLKEMQAAWDALAEGDPSPAFEALAEDIVLENAAGPWRRIDGRDALAGFLLELASLFQGDWRQVGRVVHLDDDCAVTIVKETGTAHSGDAFDNVAVFVSRVGADGKINRLWTVDLAQEATEAFWARNPPDR
jgi:ketosteroid isomerase-like protein